MAIAPGDMFWLFFMLSALQPAVQKYLLETSRQRLIAKIERQRNSRVILLVHRQAPISPFPKGAWLSLRA